MVDVKVIQHCCNNLEEPFDTYEGTILLQGNPIGRFYAKLWHFDQVEDLMEAADHSSPDDLLICETLIRVLTGWCGKLLIIETVFLEPEYRGEGYAKEALKQFCRQFNYTMIALKAFPLQYSGLVDNGSVDNRYAGNFKKDLCKLKKVYKSWGFKSLKNNVMYSMEIN